MNKFTQEIRTLYIEFSNNHSQLIDNIFDTIRKKF